MYPPVPERENDLSIMNHAVLQFCTVIKAALIFSGCATLCQTGKRGQIKQSMSSYLEKAILFDLRNILVYV